MLNQSLYSSQKTDWETPQALYDVLDEEFRFALDVCATSDNAKCKKYISPEKDGLRENWGNGPVWMNPPYGREIREWVKKAYEEGQRGCDCVCLLPVRSDTRWWHEYVMRAKEIRLLSRRLSFCGSSNKAPFSAAIVVFSKEAKGRPLLSSMTV